MAVPSNAPGQEAVHAALIARHGAENQAKIERARIGIAGLGGLGSAVAIHLARLGVGTLVLADFDVVDVSNLHRQQYSLEHLGMPKTEAIAKQLHAINPFIKIELHATKLTVQNIPQIFDGCTIVCEAFDQPDQKAMLIETLLTKLPHANVISGSGMAGTGSANSIETTHPFANLYVCGDKVSDIGTEGSLISPRVGVCAGHQATMALRLILGESEP